VTTQRYSDLRTFRGACPTAPLDARRVAALVENPGCGRRAVLDAAAVPLDKVAELIGCPPAHQSPFAIQGGIQFERIVTENGLAHVVRLAREHLGLDVPEVRQVDLSMQALIAAHGTVTNELRCRLTDQHLEAALTQRAGAVNLLRHPMTRLEVSGMTCFLEQDVLALAVAGRIHVCEIKSFACVDGIADPDKVAAAMRQSAVYVMSLQDTVAALGFDPVTVVSTRVMLIMTTNFTFFPTASVVDVGSQVRRLRRQLAHRPDVEALVAGLAPEVSLPGLPASSATEEERQAASHQAADAVAALPARFGDGCLNCPLYRYCRREAQTNGSLERLGTDVANACGEVTSISVAIGLARGRRRPSGPGEAAVADVLARAHDVAARYGTA